MTSTSLHRWPVNDPWTGLGILHGLGDHGRRYEHAALLFNARKIHCVAAELPGHGQRPGTRGHIPNMEAAYDTLDFMVEKLREDHPQVPIFLLGQSMGGNILLNYLLDRKPAIAGAVAMSSWIRLPNPPPKALEVLGKVMSRFLPSLTLSNGLDPIDLATSPDVAKAYMEDPLTHDRISFRTATIMLEAARRLDEFSGAFPVPVLLLHGEADRITDCEGSWQLAKRCANVEVNTWKNLHHELFNETPAPIIVNSIVEWMNRVSSNESIL